MGVEAWSTVAASNNASPPNGAPEGMAPSAVNDTIRQIMASVRAQLEDGQWFNWGHAPTRVDGDTFTVASDLTAIYHAGRRLKVTGSATGYCTVASSSYSSPNTTVNVTMDSGNLPATLTAVHVGLITAAGSLPSDVALKSGSNVFTGLVRVQRSDAAYEVWKDGTPSVGATFAINSTAIGGSTDAVTLARYTSVGGWVPFIEFNGSGGSLKGGDWNVTGSLKVGGVEVATKATGSFTATLTGVTSTVTGTIKYVVSGGVVTLYADSAISGTTDLGGVGFSGLPAGLRPAAVRCTACIVSQPSSSTAGQCIVASNGAVTFTRLNVSGGTVNLFGGWDPSTSAGIPAGWTVSYPL